MKSFSEFPLSALLKSNLQKNGFKEPTAVQAQAIEPALAGRDVVATAQTGTGKTLAFVLPIIDLLAKEPARSGVRAVILSPTRELALQIHETFAKMAAGSQVRAAVVIGGVGENPQLQAIRKGAQVVIATPGRLYDFLSRNLVVLGNVRILVLDEADRMLDMGFLPTIKRIMAVLPAERQTLFFSATIESSVKHLVETHVRNAVRVEDRFHHQARRQDRPAPLRSRGRSQTGPAASDAARRATGRFWYSPAPSMAPIASPSGCRTEGVKTATIHGNRSQNQRTQALRGFQDGYYRVLVATDIAARGIHVEGIAHVVNYDLPQVAEDFIHRVGRTGTRRRGRHRFDFRYPRRACGYRANRTDSGHPPGAPHGFLGCVPRRKDQRPGRRDSAPPASAILRPQTPRRLNFRPSNCGHWWRGACLRHRCLRLLPVLLQ